MKYYEATKNDTKGTEKIFKSLIGNIIKNKHLKDKVDMAK